MPNWVYLFKMRLNIQHAIGAAMIELDSSIHKNDRRLLQ